MAIFTRKKDKTEKLDSATASVADENGKHSVDEAVEAQMVDAALVQEVTEGDSIAKALLELETFSMTPGAKSLLDRAMDNLSKNDGAGLEDPDAQVGVKLQAALIEAAGNDLAVVIDCLVEQCDQPRDISSQVYSVCYSALKAAGFIANLDYRRWADPRSDFDLWSQYGALTAKGEDGNDPSEGLERRTEHGGEDTAIPGLATSVDQQWEWMRETYGRDIEDECDVIPKALADLRVFLTLTTEAYGWDAERPMPYANVLEKDGSYTPITDPTTALDLFEVRRKESQKRRIAKQNERLAGAAELARQRVKAALSRRN